MELEDRVKKLEKRVKVLENDLNKRRRNKAINVIVKLIIIIIICIGLYYGYNYVNEKYIKPYKNMMNELKEVKNNVSSLKDYNSVINKYISGFTK